MPREESLARPGVASMAQQADASPMRRHAAQKLFIALMDFPAPAKSICNRIEMS